MDKLDFINIKNFCSLKDSIKEMKMQAQFWGKYLQYVYLTKDMNIYICKYI